jgi:FHA domain
MTSYRIGRGSENDIVVDDSSISRIHAELTLLPDGRFSVRDLGSSNGTMVQGPEGWELVDQATVEADQPIRFGKRMATPSELVALSGAAVAHGDGSRRERYDASTDTEARGRPSGGRPAVVSASSLPRGVVPAAAGGGGLVLIAIVVVVLLLGPLGGASSSDFVRNCSVHIGSQTRCTCWAGALGERLSGQDFVELTAAIRKRDWQTAMPPALREKFTEVQAAITARCGPLS